MCGVAGVLYFDQRQPTREVLVRMSDAVAHRGPDGDGHEVLGACGLAHRRLSIIDLSEAGRQPMSYADGRLWLTFNGEIYNYVELRATLEARGHTFRSQTDSEVILAAYLEWGPDAFSRFNGMWGLGIWDARARELVLSRDRIGIKPLYYFHDGRRLLFASEIKAILAADPALAVLDRRSVARFLMRPALGHGRRTFFDRIDAIEPGTVVTFDETGASRTRRYWTFLPPAEPLRVERAEAARRVEDLLTDSVRLRFRADVPVGTCLSGGLDSSSIVSIAKKKLGKAPATFSAIYADPKYDEGRFVEVMVRELELEGHEVRPDGSDLAEVLERAMYFQESATGGPGIYSQWHVMRIAAGHVKVLLDGQGGDEVFAGYHRHYAPYVRSLLDSGALIAAVRASRSIREATGEDPLREILGYALAKVRRRVGGSSSAQPLLRPEMADLVAPERDSWAQSVITGDALTDTLWDTLVRTSMPCLLHYEDRNSMAFSLEARTPFLDHNLIEYVFSLPTWMKIDGARTKVILRDAMQAILPEAIRDRSDKMGYPTPFATWLRGGHADWIRDLLCSTAASEREFVDPGVASTLIDDHLGGLEDNAWPLYQLATLELFCRRYFDQPFVAD